MKVSTRCSKNCFKEKETLNDVSNLQIEEGFDMYAMTISGDPKLIKIWPFCRKHYVFGITTTDITSEPTFRSFQSFCVIIV